MKSIIFLCSGTIAGLTFNLYADALTGEKCISGTLTEAQEEFVAAAYSIVAESTPVELKEDWRFGPHKVGFPPYLVIRMGGTRVWTYRTDGVMRDIRARVKESVEIPS